MPKIKTWPASRVEVDGVSIAAEGFGFVKMIRGVHSVGSPDSEFPIKGKVTVYRNGMVLIRGKRYGENLPEALSGEVDRMVHLSSVVINFSFPRPEVSEENPANERDGEGDYDGGEG